MVQSLVHTLLDVFDATRDLYQTLKSKQRRDYEQNLRSRGYRRNLEFLDDGPDGEAEIVMDKAAVMKQLDIGLQDIGPQFAVGDGKKFPTCARARLECSRHSFQIQYLCQQSELNRVVYCPSWATCYTLTYSNLFNWVKPLAW